MSQVLPIYVLKFKCRRDVWLKKQQFSRVQEQLIGSMDDDPYSDEAEEASIRKLGCIFEGMQQGLRDIDYCLCFYCSVAQRNDLICCRALSPLLGIHFFSSWICLHHNMQLPFSTSFKVYSSILNVSKTKGQSVSILLVGREWTKKVTEVKI